MSQGKEYTELNNGVSYDATWALLYTATSRLGRGNNFFKLFF